MTTDPNSLPQWKGHPVPWVARWTGEVSHDAAQVRLNSEGHVEAGYPDGNNVRDSSGVLWIRTGLTRAGEPEYAEINNMRQRAAMNRRLCQVCGQRITAKVIPWLLTEPLIQVNEAGETLIDSAPTCEDCVPLALKMCPHLRTNKPIIARVLDYSTWGVWGSVVHVNNEGRAVETKGLSIPYEGWTFPFSMRSVIARKQIVRFDKFVLEDA